MNFEECYAVFDFNLYFAESHSIVKRKVKWIPLNSHLTVMRTFIYKSYKKILGFLKVIQWIIDKNKRCCYNHKSWISMWNWIILSKQYYTHWLRHISNTKQKLTFRASGITGYLLFSLTQSFLWKIAGNIRVWRRF